MPPDGLVLGAVCLDSGLAGTLRVGPAFFHMALSSRAACTGWSYRVLP